IKSREDIREASVNIVQSVFHGGDIEPTSRKHSSHEDQMVCPGPSYDVLDQIPNHTCMDGWPCAALVAARLGRMQNLGGTASLKISPAHLKTLSSSCHLRPPLLNDTERQDPVRQPTAPAPMEYSTFAPSCEKQTAFVCQRCVLLDSSELPGA